MYRGVLFVNFQQDISQARVAFNCSVHFEDLMTGWPGGKLDISSVTVCQCIHLDLSGPHSISRDRVSRERRVIS